MADLTSLSPAALGAAAKTGAHEWGQHGSVLEHARYVEPRPSDLPRRKCGCGCGKFATHMGCANGITFKAGCEFSVRLWVKDPDQANAIAHRKEEAEADVLRAVLEETRAAVVAGADFAGANGRERAKAAKRVAHMLLGLRRRHPTHDELHGQAKKLQAALSGRKEGGTP